MSTGSFPLPRGAAPGSAEPRDTPPAISSSSDAGPTPAATICWYRVHVPARSDDDSAPIGADGAAGFRGATAVGGGCDGGCEGIAAAPPSRRTASVTPASAAAIAVSSLVPDVERMSPALRTSAAKSAGWFTAILLVTASRAACANSATRSATDPPPADPSEEHTSELQSPCNLVCRLLLEKK